MLTRVCIPCACFVLILSLFGCGYPPANVTAYVALDREYSEAILTDFEKQSRVKVAAKYDIESTKTVGLTNAILQEQHRPRCDLFWNNEILHTIRLDQAGLLRKFTPQHAADVPPAFASPNGTYYGFAARARVLLVNIKLVPAEEFPTSILDLVAPRWQGKVGIAKPLFGTTATHAAVLWQTWGKERAMKFFVELHEQAQVLNGNKRVAESVGRGELAFGLTDTDDAMIEVEAGSPVRIVFPDQQPDGLGTLLIPNTIAVLKNSPQPQAAEALANHLLRPDTELRLANCPSRQIPILTVAGTMPQNAATQLSTEGIRWQSADFVKAAEVWEETVNFLHETFAK